MNLTLTMTMAGIAFCKALTMTPTPTVEECEASLSVLLETKKRPFATIVYTVDATIIPDNFACVHYADYAELSALFCWKRGGKFKFDPELGMFK